ncbi:hypothetical protein FDG2_4251 [Candidatus Protofrankia californiensis]|uniref:Right handed beta helix domain-containing protein n=1 Tax=Candidatus Protofrankia californiensis TaxID=1839754 RepID=A0A1C3P4E6_9ACTN|nr:hypothetical protein FDG2_4251 [Candidatus Protofrankia californiensis]
MVDIRAGRLVLDGCDVSGGASAGVAVHNGADPRVRRNRITNSQDAGVWVSGNGAGLFEDNIVIGNRRAAWNVSGADRTRMIRR